MSVPWFIGQPGALHPAEVARLLTYAATSGSEGVTGIGDLKVVPLATPGNGLRVLSGGAVLRNRHTGGGNRQSYVDYNPAAVTVTPLTGTGTGQTRSDLVVWRVQDPQYPGMPTPSDVANGPYSGVEVITGVPAGTTRTKDLGLNYPAVALARIDWPENTSTVTAAMIKDVRRVANPRRERMTFLRFPGSDNNVPNTAYSRWPTVSSEQLYVPEWATKVNIIGHLSGVEFIGSSATVAGLRTWFGDASGTSGGSSENGIMQESSSGRYHYSIAGVHNIPIERRDSEQWVMLQAWRTAGSGTFQADYQTTVIMDVEFVEEAV